MNNLSENINFKKKFISINEIIFNFTNILVGIVFLFALLASVLRITYTGIKLIYIYQAFLIVLIWLIFFLKKVLKFELRILILVFILLAFDLLTIPTFKMQGSWGHIPILFSFIIGMFYGRKAGLLSVAYSFLYISVFTFIFILKPKYVDVFSILKSTDLVLIIFRLGIILTTSIIVVYSISKYRDFFLKTFSDLILAKKKTDESEKKYKKLSNLTFEGILLHSNGVAIDMNLSLEKMFGYSKDEMLGENLIELLILKSHHKTIFQNINKNYAKPYEIDGIKKDGTIIPLEIEARTIGVDEKDNNIRVVALRDITERKKAEQIIKQQNKEYLAVNE